MIFTVSVAGLYANKSGEVSMVVDQYVYAHQGSRNEVELDAVFKSTAHLMDKEGVPFIQTIVDSIQLDRDGICIACEGEL